MPRRVGGSWFADDGRVLGEYHWYEPLVRWMGLPLEWLVERALRGLKRR